MARQASAVAMRQAAETVARAHIPVLVVSGGYSPAQDKKGGDRCETHSLNARRRFVSESLCAADEFEGVQSGGE
jgi:hypothetical protein